VDEAAVHDAVGLRRAAAQGVQVLEIAAMDIGAELAQRVCAGVRPRVAQHRVAVLQQFGNEGAADEAGGAGEEDSHGGSPGRGG
jgi:hypothetical protein